MARTLAKNPDCHAVTVHFTKTREKQTILSKLSAWPKKKKKKESNFQKVSAVHLVFTLPSLMLPDVLTVITPQLEPRVNRSHRASFPSFVTALTVRVLFVAEGHIYILLPGQ